MLSPLYIRKLPNFILEFYSPHEKRQWRKKDKDQEVRRKWMNGTRQSPFLQWLSTSYSRLVLGNNFRQLDKEFFRLLLGPLKRIKKTMQTSSTSANMFQQSTSPPIPRPIPEWNTTPSPAPPTRNPLQGLLNGVGEVVQGADGNRLLQRVLQLFVALRD